MIVLADARLEAASSAAVWGAFTNCGQACLSIERIFVERSIAERFHRARRRQDAPVAARPRQRSRQRNRPDDSPASRGSHRSAIASRRRRRRASAHRRPPPSRSRSVLFRADGPDQRDSRHAHHARADLRPLVAIQPSAAPMRLSPSPTIVPTAFPPASGPPTSARGREIAQRIRAGIGAVMVNDLASYFGMLEAPHGGGGLSGWGRTHSRLGLLEMVQVRYVDEDWLPRLPKTWWFGYDRALTQAAGAVYRVFARAPVAQTMARRRRSCSGAVSRPSDLDHERKLTI